MKGTFVGLKAGKVVLSGLDSDHDVVTNPDVKLDGKPAKLDDLKPGDTVTLSDDKPATTVIAVREVVTAATPKTKAEEKADAKEAKAEAKK